MTRARRPGSRIVRRRRRVALLLVAAVLAIGISALAVQRSGGPRAAGGAAHAGHKAPGDPVAGTGGTQSVVLRERPARRLAAPVQAAAAAAAGRGRVLIAGGLTAADTSRSDIQVVAPAGAAARGRLPVRLHDAAAVAIGGAVYVVGGADFQTSSTIYRVDPRTGRATAAARLPVPMSDVAATVLRGTAYVVGGYTGSRWLDTVLAWRPGMRPHAVARLPQPLRYAAVTAAGGRLVVAGGSTPAGASRRVLALDPAHGAVRSVGLLPAPTTHAAAATIDGVAYVIGGRGATPGTPTDRIVAVDPGTGRVRAAGSLTSPRSDLAAVSLGGGVLLVGGRGAATEATVSRLVPATNVASAARGRAIEPRNVYRADRAGALSPVVAHDPPRVYVPNSASNTVDVIDSRTYRVIGHFPVGGLPQHVVPSWDLRTLYVTNDAGNSLTPIDPSTGRRRGRPIRVNDPYNLYFTPDGRYAIVVAERNARLDFRDPHTMRLIRSVRVPCRGVDHMDFTADGHALVASCEFSGRLVSVDTRRLRGTGPAGLPGGGLAAAGRQALAGRLPLLRRGHDGRRGLEGGRVEPPGARVRADRRRRPRALPEPRRAPPLRLEPRRGNGVGPVVRDRTGRRDLAGPRRQPGHGRRLRGRPRALAVGPLRRRGLRHRHAERPADRPHPGRVGTTRRLRLAAARPAFARPHRDPAMREDAPGCGARILVLSAEVGEGHVAAARALAAGMSAPPFLADVAVVDGLAVLGGPLRALIRDGYRLQLRVAPWSYGALFALATHPPGLWAARGGLSLLAGRPVRRLVRSHRPD